MLNERSKITNLSTARPGLIRLFLSSVLAILFLAGCSNNASPASTPMTEPASSSQATEPPSSAEPVEAPAGAVIIEIQNGSEARYIAKEQLADRDLPSDAIGKTSEVSGMIVFNSKGSLQPDSSKITVNLQSLTSDESRRDNFIRDNGLESNRFPEAQFVVQEASGLPWPLPESGEADFQLTGDMTVHGVTQPLTWDVSARFASGSVTGQASTMLTFEQFNMKKPSLFFILSLDDELQIELDFDASVS